MSWRFPEIKFVKKNNAAMQIEHVLSEAEEVGWEYFRCCSGVKGGCDRIDEEMADLTHSLETYWRIRINEGADVHQIFSQVVEKNRKRNYYAE